MLFRSVLRPTPRQLKDRDSSFPTASPGMFTRGSRSEYYTVSPASLFEREGANEFSLPVTAAALAGHDSKRVGVHHHQRTLPILFSTSNLPSLSSDRCGPSLSGLPSPVVAGRPTISPPELARTPFPLHHEAGKAQRRSSVVSLVRSATRLRPSVPPALAGSQVPEKEGLSVGIKAVARGGIGRLGCARGARKGVRAGA